MCIRDSVVSGGGVVIVFVVDVGGGVVIVIVVVIGVVIVIVVVVGGGLVVRPEADLSGAPDGPGIAVKVVGRPGVTQAPSLIGEKESFHIAIIHFDHEF